MHQAGFDVDHYEELVRRRERWRRLRGGIGSLVGSLAVEVGLRAPRSEATETGVEPLATHAETGRATLHDELMRKAGFETDFHRELERRRERRRRLSARTAIRFGWLVLIAAGVIDLWAHHFSGMPKPIAAAAVAVGFAFQVGDFVKNKLVPWMEDQP